jgi:menaquinone-dependent protoporphyrinogen IX oxidase
MKKYLVLYYSKTGNSKFLAQKAATALGCDLRPIKPIINNTALLFLLSSLKISIAIDVSKEDIEKYDEVIIFGPIWGGLLISPLKNALKKCAAVSKAIHFAVSCETSDSQKNEKYGYAHVLQEAENSGGQFVKTTEAFSTALVNKDNKSWTPKLSEKIKITEENFEGAIKERFENFIAKIKS